MAASSVAFGLAFNGPLIYWIHLFGMLPYVALTIVQTLWLVGALQVGLVLRNRLPAGGRLLALPLVFLLQEFARSRVPWGGFSWGVLGYTQHDNVFALQLAAYTGVWGLSLILLLINSLLADTLVRWGRGPRHRVAGVGAAVLLAAFPALLPAPGPDGQTATLAMVQGNVPGDAVHPNDDDEEVLDNHIRLTDRVDGETVDLVIWPEGTFDQDPFRRADFAQELVGAVRRTDTPFVVGAILGSSAIGEVRNTSVFMDARGEVVDVYTKQRLVPFGEWVPLRRFLEPWVPHLRRVPVDQSRGDESKVFELPQGVFAAPICYESTYPDLIRSFVLNGARMIVVSANFSSYEDTAASAQHIAFSQLRAAEQRMWVAHTSVSGISAVVDPRGRVVERTELFEPALLTPTVQFATSLTPYARFGDWLVVATAVGVIVLLLLPARAAPRDPDD